MNFLDHLEELRGRLIKSVVAVFVFSVPCFVFWRKILSVLMEYPIHRANPKPHLIFTAPAEAALLSMKIALVGGFIISIPFVFYQVWTFISPGLYGKEKKIVLPVVFASSFCFFVGLAFAYYTLPFLLMVLTRFGNGVIEPYFKASEYISFLIKMGLAFGIIFEMPVLSWFLTRMGLLTPKFLVDKLRHAVVAIFIVAAIITPPDVVSQFFLAVPLLVIYGISILVSYLSWERPK